MLTVFKIYRVYDIRNTSEAMYVLGANIGAIRSLHFSHDGQYLAAAGNIYIISCHMMDIVFGNIVHVFHTEPIDFVHIYETKHFESSQVIDMFGDIAGVCKSLFFYIVSTIPMPVLTIISQ